MLRRFTNLAFLTSLVVLHVSACSSSRTAADGWAGTTDTLPNGTVWVSNPARGIWDDDSRWTLTEEFRIGSVDSEGPDQFGEVWAITADSLGGIYVADRLSNDVRVFDSGGRHLRTLGRSGRGPGEFEIPYGMTWGPAGNLWVVDVRAGRYTVFDSQGTLLATYPRTSRGYSWPWAGGFTRDGLLVEEHLTETEGAPLVGHRISGRQLTATDSFPDPLGTPPITEPDLFDLTDEDGLGAIIAVPFGRRWLRTLDAVGGVWVGYNGDYRIAHQTLEGDTVMLIGREATPVAVGLRDRSAAVADLGEFRDHPGIDLNRIPDTKPWFAALLPSPDGSLWALRDLEGTAWGFDVFDFKGRFLGTVPLPMTPEVLPPPVILNDGVLLVTRDELDVPHVVRLRLVRGT